MPESFEDYQNCPNTGKVDKMEQIVEKQVEITAKHSEQIGGLKDSISLLRVYTEEAVKNIEEHNEKQNGHIGDINQTLVLLEERTKGLRVWVRISVLLLILHISGVVVDIKSLIAWFNNLFSFIMG